MRKAFSKRQPREACPECGKKTLSHYKPIVKENGLIISAEDICRSCKSIFIKGIKIERSDE